MSQQQSRYEAQDPEDIAAYMGMGMVYHDKRKRQMSVDAFAKADRFQFPHVDDDIAREASKAYVDALWAKDDVEDRHRDEDGNFDREALDNADWTPVCRAFERRASLLGIDPEYAELSTRAWRRHKTGGDYWTPMQKAQMYELRAALRDPEYPHKQRNGQSGFGPEATRYVLSVELHDMRRFDEGLDAMTPYFERIARAHEDHSSTEWDVSESR